MADGGSVDITKSDRKLWLLKVPTYLAKRWHEAIDEAMNAQVGDSDDEDEGAAGKCTGSAGPSKASRDIGTVQIAANKDVFIQVPADGGKTTRSHSRWGTMCRYRMMQQTDMPKTYVFSVHGEEAEQEGLQPRVEGVVQQQFSLVPDSLSTGTDGRLVVDPQYMNMHKRRVEDAKRKTRETENIKDEREMRQRLISAVPINMTRRAGPSQQNKRPKLDKDDLERELFKLFEGKANWTIPELQKETGQSVTWLKEVLGGVADFQKKGAHVGTFELRPEYRARQ